MPLISSRKTSKKHINLGKAAENYVTHWLQQDGYYILAQNYRKRYGEIDIIAKKTTCISFIEVKCRTKQYFNTSEVIDKSKQQKIIKTAKMFALEHNIQDHVLRFDVALLKPEKNTFNLTYIPNAFNEESI